MTQGRMEAGAGVMPGVPAAAKWLGLAGLLPFVAGAAGLAIAGGGEAGALLAAALTGYGAVILSFMGGCRWGLAAAGMGDGPALRPLAISVVPALYAWVVALAPAPAAMALLALGFAGLLAADLALAREGGAPTWWPALRWPLSLGAAGALLLGAALA